MNSDTGKRFAAVWRIRGEIIAVDGAGRSERKLREGDPVFIGERVSAAPTAEAVLKTDDAGMVAIRPGAEFVAERFAAQGESSDSFTMRLITGSLRVITGWIGRTNQAGNRIVTPTATIGIRGTDHEPYVLAKDLAGANIYRAGTYDKVNRGRTMLEAAGQSLDIDAGKVGFARAASGKKERALMTLLLPVLLEKVPDFYVPGEFDAELDRYSQTADEVSQQQLDLKRKSNVPSAVKACAPATIAKAWLAQLDGSIIRRDASGILEMFAPEVAIRAIVIKKDGSTATIELGRDEFSQSTLNAVKSLKDYKHRRVSLEAKAADSDTGKSCEQLVVKSVVIEQGLQAGKRFRFESQEEYLLELRDQRWLAIKAETTQR
ncbi:MAG: hypothetical protein HY847_18075 [Betaproteobacteria bacterium]|nr:hypothetical protein [Betaproteobacteria bacterium]